MRDKLYINYGKDKENVVYSFGGILYSDEDGCATPPYNNMHLMCLENIMLSEISQTQKDKCCIIPLT